MNGRAAHTEPRIWRRMGTWQQLRAAAVNVAGAYELIRMMHGPKKPVKDDGVCDLSQVIEVEEEESYEPLEPEHATTSARPLSPAPMHPSHSKSTPRSPKPDPILTSPSPMSQTSLRSPKSTIRSPKSSRLPKPTTRTPQSPVSQDNAAPRNNADNSVDDHSFWKTMVSYGEGEELAPYMQTETDV